MRLSIQADYPDMSTLSANKIDTGIQMDKPIFIEYGYSRGYAYIFQISRRHININEITQFLKIGNEGIVPHMPDVLWKIPEDCYEKLRKELIYLRESIAFSEMMYYLDHDDIMCEATQKLEKDTKVYDENFNSDKCPMREGHVSFQKNLTLATAKPYVNKGKRVAVLNFANPVQPGGDVQKNRYQEVCLCRSGNLYKSLTSENARDYYAMNKAILKKNQFNSMFIGTDRVIYSPGVTILKNTFYRPMFMDKEDEQYMALSHCLDVLSCSAPFFSGSGYILPNGDLEHVLKRRIRNIFEVAIENEIEVLVLGAFGCGGFHNPPELVAESFREVILEERYKNAFDEIVFAVKKRGTICPVIEVFERNFSDFPNINENGSGAE